MKLDMTKLTNNLMKMAQITCKAEIALRPYYVHIPFIAKLQMEYGACGMAVETIQDIKELIPCGIFDFLMVKELEDYNEIIEMSLTYRIILTLNLNSDLSKLIEACKKYHQCIEVVVNYDFSQNYQDYIQYIQEIQKYDELDFAGIQAFSNTLATTKDYYQRYDQSYDIEEDLGKLLEECQKKEIQVDIVTGLSSASTKFREEKYFDTHFTESQAGNYAIGTKYSDYSDLDFEQAITELDDPKVYLVDGDIIIDEL